MDSPYITSPNELTSIAKNDRFAKLLIRYRGVSEGRFVCSAMYAHEMMQMLTDTGRYVRDIEKLAPFA